MAPNVATSLEEKAVRLPYFVAVGPPRTGTTWLHRVLMGHVGLPAGLKETHFFSFNYGKGLDWYRGYFENCPPGLPVGEVTPTYFDHPEAPERIAHDLPGCRVICSLRNPVERVYSQYKVWSNVGLIDGRFDFEKQRALLSASRSYPANLEIWRETLGAQNVMVVLYDDLRENPQAYLDSICSFIGIGPIDLSTSPNGAPTRPSNTFPRSMRMARVGQRLKEKFLRRRQMRLASSLEHGGVLWRLFFTGGKPISPLDPAIEQHLRELFRPEVEVLETMLHRDLSAWK